MLADLGPAVNRQPGYRRADSQSTQETNDRVKEQLLGVQSVMGLNDLWL